MRLGKIFLDTKIPLKVNGKDYMLIDPTMMDTNRNEMTPIGSEGNLGHGSVSLPESCLPRIRGLLEELRNSAWLMCYKGKNNELLWLAHQNFA
jgi:hypothetical protein